MLGTTSAVISAWEKGMYSPEYEKLILLCDNLEVTPNDLICPEKETNTLTEIESQILSAVRNTLPYGQQRVLQDALYQRNQYPADGEYKTKPSPVFLSEDDPDYNMMKEKVTELIELKEQTKYSHEQIVRFLWLAGYDGKVSLFNIKQLFWQKKVPSEELYRYIRAFMTYQYVVAIVE